LPHGRLEPHTRPHPWDAINRVPTNHGSWLYLKWIGPKGQSISNKGYRCGLCQQFGALRSSQHDHKILKTLLWLKGLRRRNIALLGFRYSLLRHFLSQTAMALAVQEVNDQANGQPDDEAYDGDQRQAHD
jgi:hypothetical protein